MKLLAIHQIRHRPDENKPEEVVEPGYVFDMKKKEDSDFLLANGAAREPTKEEVQAHALATGSAKLVAVASKANPDDLLGEK